MKCIVGWVSGLKDDFLLTSSCLVSLIIEKKTFLKNNFFGKFQYFEALKLHEILFAPCFRSESYLNVNIILHGTKTI